ncbi:pyrroline-5-carboxylate reductase [Novosphingobium sp. PS1R-30]|uniref:Pyrroline-5-carboxylate reductase n=1 Tax=Novosphingobium anseongense TaxID=3133436 RepID=A0ABU8S163_9SPHN
MLDTILIIGCGNMGGAMLAGWLAGGIAPSRFTVVDPVLAEAPRGVTLLRELPKGARFDVVMLGVKPQMLAEVAPTIAPLIGSDTTLLSILAGAELATLATLFPAAGARVRIMPNLSAAIGRSPIALATQAIDADRQAEVTALMDPLGTPEWIPEDQFDVVTALAGSGPAFVYRFIDALAAGAAALGLDAGQAQRLALATVEGASLLAAASEHSPGELARRVASPGGTTQAGLDVLDADSALARLAQDTLKAAADRNAEMAKATRA